MKSSQRDGETCLNSHKARLGFKILSSRIHSQCLTVPCSSYTVNGSSGDHQPLLCVPQASGLECWNLGLGQGQSGNCGGEAQSPAQATVRGASAVLPPVFQVQGLVSRQLQLQNAKSRLGQWEGVGAGTACRHVHSPQH